jgi:hypothetical protein
MVLVSLLECIMGMGKEYPLPLPAREMRMFRTDPWHLASGLFLTHPTAPIGGRRLVSRIRYCELNGQTALLFTLRICACRAASSIGRMASMVPGSGRAAQRTVAAISSSLT